jgi:hypothetical protein
MRCGCVLPAMIRQPPLLLTHHALSLTRMHNAGQVTACGRRSAAHLAATAAKGFIRVKIGCEAREGAWAASAGGGGAAQVVRACHLPLHDVLLCCAMLCDAMLSYVMLCYAMLCYAMLCDAMLCYVMRVACPFMTCIMAPPTWMGTT